MNLIVSLAVAEGEISPDYKPGELIVLDPDGVARKQLLPVFVISGNPEEVRADLSAKLDQFFGMINATV